MKRIVLAALLLCIAAPVFAIELTFTDSVASVRGIARGGTALLFTIASVPREWDVRVDRKDLVLVDDDRDGVVTWTSPEPFHRRSIWVAVDLEEGSFVFGTPLGYRFATSPLIDTAIKKDNAGQLRKVELTRSSAEAILVRPGKGAWGGVFNQGTAKDTDGRNDNKMLFSPVDMEPLAGTTERTDDLRNKDLLFLIDSEKMDLVWLRVGNDKGGN